jgi:hypothetical protein
MNSLGMWVFGMAFALTWPHAGIAVGTESQTEPS